MSGDTEDRGVGACPDCGGSGIFSGAGSYYDKPGRGKPCARCIGIGRCLECPPWCKVEHIHLRLRGF